jgi:hypothetical protein
MATGWRRMFEARAAMAYNAAPPKLLQPREQVAAHAISVTRNPVWKPLESQP